MILKDEHTLSLLPKLVLMVTISSTTLLAVSLMLENVTDLVPWLNNYAIQGNQIRQLVIMLFLIVYVVRLFITVFVFLKSKMTWVEMLIVTILMSFALYSFANVGGNSLQPLGFIDFIAIAFYILGSCLNTRSEHTRHIWKKNPVNKGKLYTEGLFKYSMHINYFGDILLFIGFALITTSISMLFIPLVMTLNFVFFVIPRLDKYLANKYGEDFKEYAYKTKKLIPGIY